MHSAPISLRAPVANLANLLQCPVRSRSSRRAHMPTQTSSHRGPLHKRTHRTKAVFNTQGGDCSSWHARCRHSRKYRCNSDVWFVALKGGCSMLHICPASLYVPGNILPRELHCADLAVYNNLLFQPPTKDARAAYIILSVAVDFLVVAVSGQSSEGARNSHDQTDNR